MGLGQAHKMFQRQITFQFRLFLTNKSTALITHQQRADPSLKLRRRGNGQDLIWLWPACQQRYDLIFILKGSPLLSHHLMQTAL